MENVVRTRLQTVQFGPVQTYKNIAILPLTGPADGKLQYRTLGEALAAWDIAITEVSAAGSVPELNVTNRANTPVLLIDGEELAGAKQNRVLNTSILLKEISETRIPVSCTERGRWSYASKAFTESGNVMAYKSRSRKTRSVQRSLECSGAHLSDQGEVWDGIAELQAKACAHSPTSAMSDVYKARDQDLRKCDEIFTPVPNQIGLLAFIGGRPAGADMVSLTTAYAKLHPKLVRSYTLEGLLEQGRAPSPRPPSRSPVGAGEGGCKPGEGPTAKSKDPQPAQLLALAKSFLEEITTAEERQFPSIGHGTDYRYRSGPSTINNQLSTVCGSALVHENELIHAAFFRLDDPEQPERMASYRSRRRHYRE